MTMPDGALDEPLAAQGTRKMILQLLQDNVHSGEEVVLPPAHRIVYRVSHNEATYSSGEVTLTADDGHVLRFELTDEIDGTCELAESIEIAAGDDCIMRCDRVELPPGGIAHLHTHQGPGIRCLVEGRFRVLTNGGLRRVPLYGSWFEPGPIPVRAEAGDAGPAAFVRVMILPVSLKGRSSITYVGEGADETIVKPQRYTVFTDRVIRP
jgi:quercetin dioxygenase-like cupin family protein